MSQTLRKSWGLLGWEQHWGLGDAAPTLRSTEEFTAGAAASGRQGGLAGWPFHLHPFFLRAEPRAAVSIFQENQ